jgi:hypothetical protein
MSEPNRLPMMDIKCPFCNSTGQQLENLGDHPCYLSGTCDTCNRDFSVDIIREEYYNEKGDIIT